jgi:hypothetical protein
MRNKVQQHQNQNQEETIAILAAQSRQPDFSTIDPNKIKISHKLQQNAIQKDTAHLSRIPASNELVAQQKPRPNYLILINGKIEAECLSQEETESDLDDILNENPDIDRSRIEVWQKVGIKVGVFLDI